MLGELSRAKCISMKQRIQIDTPAELPQKPIEPTDLPDEGSFDLDKTLELKYILSKGDWQGVTYKEDVKSMRLSLKKSSKTFYV